MTFKDEQVRLQFHSLPTATQVNYADWEAKLAKRNARLHIDDVIAAGPISEIVIRITENFQLTAVNAQLTVGKHD